MTKLKEQVQPSFTQKSYQAPTLRVYGDIRLLTQISNNLGLATDAMTGPLKTQ
jgi:hypothetical protein